MNGETAERALRRLAGTHKDDFESAFQVALEEARHRVPAFDADAGQHDVLGSIVSRLADGLREQLMHAPAVAVAPSATRSLARETVHWGLPADVMLEALFVGHQGVTRWWLGRLRDDVADPAVRLEAAQISSELFHAFTGAVMRLFAEEYAAERAVWSASTHARRRELVEILLSGDIAPDEAAISTRLGYRLHGTHVAVYLWRDVPLLSAREDEQLERTALNWSRDAGGAHPLTVHAGPSQLWLWLRAERVKPSALPDGMRASIGEPGHGVAGFRASHHEARRAREVALQYGLDRPVVRYAEIERLALLSDDPIAQARFVQRQLGSLGDNSPRARRVRPTVRAWLEHGAVEDTIRAANVHRNTLTRHLALAEELRGRSLNHDRVSLALALELHAALTRGGAPRADSASPQPADVPVA